MVCHADDAASTQQHELLYVDHTDEESTCPERCTAVDHHRCLGIVDLYGMCTLSLLNATPQGLHYMRAGCPRPLTAV